MNYLYIKELTPKNQEKQTTLKLASCFRTDAEMPLRPLGAVWLCGMHVASIIEWPTGRV